MRGMRMQSHAVVLRLSIDDDETVRRSKVAYDDDRYPVKVALAKLLPFRHGGSFHLVEAMLFSHSFDVLRR